MGKPTFYTAFANSMREEEFLPNLSEEATKISDLLQGLVFEDTIYYIKDEIFNGERMILNFSKYGDKFDIFYFSGHAKNGSLVCSDNFTTKSDNMASVINNNLKNLKLAFFNACETYLLARQIVERKMQDSKEDNLILISCRSQINAFVAERFATLFFSQIGRPGSYYDAYLNAKNLVCLLNDKIVFKEFYDYDDLKAAGNDFDYAYIDLSRMTTKNKPEIAQPAKPAEVVAITPPSAFAPTAQPATATTIPPAKAAAPKPVSIINPSKETRDVLAANYLKEVVQTITTAETVSPKKVNAIAQALTATQQFAGGEGEKKALTNVWKKVKDIVPGLDPKIAMQSLLNIEKGDYTKVMNSFYTTPDNNPTLSNLVQKMSSIKV